MTQPYKICPQCQEPAAVAATQCARCGRIYRSTSPQQTQVFANPPAQAPAPAPRGLYFGVGVGAGCLLAIGLLCFFVWMIFSGARSQGGTQTAQLAAKMQVYIPCRPYEFEGKFGRPDSMSNTNRDGIEFYFWNYRCKDGTVTVTFNSTTQYIERVSTEGP